MSCSHHYEATIPTLYRVFVGPFGLSSFTHFEHHGVRLHSAIPFFMSVLTTFRSHSICILPSSRSSSVPNRNVLYILVIIIYNFTLLVMEMAVTIITMIRTLAMIKYILQTN